MNTRLLRGLFVILMQMLLLVNQGVASAQMEQARYFPETGHWVTGEFLEMYESVPTPEMVYGYPITDAFNSEFSIDPSGTLIQYFTRARFELHPDNPTDLRVTLTLLGEYFYGRDGPGIELPVINNPYACRAIPEDGERVCYAFLRFFDNQGGIAQFGYPISELVIIDGRLVQYFQRARFEWHPELPTGHRVSLSNLGTQYFYALSEDIFLTRPSTDDVLTDLLGLQVDAFVDRAVMPQNGLQEVYVVVKNQTLMPVTGAHVVIHIELPSGAQQDFSMPLTNSNGVSELSFIVQDEPAGLVHIIVDVRANELHVTTETSFRIWK